MILGAVSVDVAGKVASENGEASIGAFVNFNNHKLVMEQELGYALSFFVE